MAQQKPGWRQWLLVLVCPFLVIDFMIQWLAYFDERCPVCKSSDIEEYVGGGIATLAFKHVCRSCGHIRHSTMEH